MAIGFTSAGRRSRAIGECWDNRRSADGHFEIFIRPDLAHAPDAMPAQIVAILAHELVHAAVGIKAGHGKPFKRVALGLGLVGPMRATTPGEAFLAAVAPILAATGPLPHARLDTGGLTTAHRKQAVRMLKCECEACGYTVRTARKWLETAGAPLCPISGHGAMRHEPLDGEEEESGGMPSTHNSPTIEAASWGAVHTSTCPRAEPPSPPLSPRLWRLREIDQPLARHWESGHLGCPHEDVWRVAVAG